MSANGPQSSNRLSPTFLSLTLTNFLSYKRATVDFGDLTALVGPNASGKSNFVAAIRLLRDISSHGLPVAVARRGGFPQIRHRSNGRPTNPSLRLEFRLGDASGQPSSHYEIAFSSVAGGTYRVKKETAVVYYRDARYEFRSDGSTVVSRDSTSKHGDRTSAIAPGHSAASGASSFASYLIFQTLSQLQTVEINPQVIREFQEPSSLGQFEPDGSNVVSIYDSLSSEQRRVVLSHLNAIVPGIVRVEVSSLAGQQTLIFGQQTPNGVREFSARQMSDGTLRAFSMLIALFQPTVPALVVLEEPEIAIHLGALRALVDILRSEARRTQIVITTHSADIADQVDVDSVRVVWSDGEASHLARVAPETRQVVHERLLTVGELMRSHALDPEAVDS
ncbi:AAA family ATPase [Agrococcus carbonis]|uniref:Predicted ATPase n=1 Tax=Agrococcus carbonis TaxID=684552 RepID=A0A1H1R2T3_9MICO|nr:ATP-binding protein [Agrococcus carbonis]SDS30091.1 Predicted ATPase [Agrococcus carbonis]